MAGVIELQNNFKGMVSNAIEDENPDNPIYRVMEGNTIMKNIDINDPSRYLLDHIIKVDEKLSDMMVSFKNKQYNTNYNRLYIPNDSMKKEMVFEMDTAIMSNNKLLGLLKRIENRNPDITFRIRYDGDDKVAIIIYGQTILEIDKVAKTIVGQEGLSLKSVSLV